MRHGRKPLPCTLTFVYPTLTNIHRDIQGVERAKELYRRVAQGDRDLHVTEPLCKITTDDGKVRHFKLGRFGGVVKAEA